MNVDADGNALFKMEVTFSINVYIDVNNRGGYNTSYGEWKLQEYKQDNVMN